MYSKNFSFDAGFGAVGRVFLSRAPLWENDLTSQSSHQFARLGGARIFGVNTAFFGEFMLLSYSLRPAYTLTVYSYPRCLYCTPSPHPNSYRYYSGCFI